MPRSFQSASLSKPSLHVLPARGAIRHPQLGRPLAPWCRISAQAATADKSDLQDILAVKLPIGDDAAMVRPASRWQQWIGAVLVGHGPQRRSAGCDSVPTEVAPKVGRSG